MSIHCILDFYSLLKVYNFVSFQSLFDPINPDKDTIVTRQFNRKDRMDNEFFFIGKLANVMKKANFTELEPSTIDRVLKEHTTRHLVRVSVIDDDQLNCSIVCDIMIKNNSDHINCNVICRIMKTNIFFAIIDT